VFKLAAVKSVKWPIDVPIPQDGGTVRKARFTAVFEMLPEGEYEEVAALDGRVAERVLIGWEGIAPEDGQGETPYSEEAKTQLLAIPYVRLAVLKAYLQAQSGTEAARKN